MKASLRSEFGWILISELAKRKEENEKENRTDLVPILVRSVESLGRTGLQSCLGNRDGIRCLAGLGTESSVKWAVG